MKLPMGRWIGPLTPLTLMAVGSLALTLLGGGAGLLVPRALEYGEPYVISSAFELSQGRPLYADVRQPPHLHNNYNPFVQVVLAPVLAWTGPRFLPGRALSLLASLGSLAVLYRILRDRGTQRLVALTAAALPALGGFVHPWFYIARVDQVALFFATTTVWLAQRSAGRPGLGGYTFLVFGFLAFAAKQSMLAAPLAMLLGRFVGGRRKSSVIAGLGFAAALAAFYVLANLWTGGEYGRHAVTYNAGHERVGLFSNENLGRLADAMRFALPLLFLAALPFLSRLRDRDLLLWVGVSALAALWMSSKSGSHVHYHQETAFGVALLLGCAGSRALEAGGPRTRGALTLIAVLAAGLAIAPAHRDWQLVKRSLSEVRAPDPLPSHLRAVLDAARDPLLLLPPLTDQALRSGQPALFDMADFVRLTDAGLFDVARDLVPEIAAHRFAVIAHLENDDDLPRPFRLASLPGLREAIAAHYQPLGQVSLPARGGLPARRALYFVPRR